VANGTYAAPWLATSRTTTARVLHLSLDKDAPLGRPIERPGLGRVISIREVGGLHHRYVRRATGSSRAGSRRSVPPFRQAAHRPTRKRSAAFSGGPTHLLAALLSTVS